MEHQAHESNRDLLIATPDRRRSLRPVKTGKNSLLAKLPAYDYERLAGALRFTSLGKRQILHKQDQPIEAIYFPNDGVCSLTQTLSDGSSIEVASVGAEGLIGVDALFGGSRSSCDVSVRIRGDSAYVLGVDALRTEMDRRGVFYDVAMKYAHTFLRELMQSMNCAALHSVKQRCARWLLMTQDRLYTHHLSVTQEAIATALGVRRATITLVINDLVKQGAVDVQRGRIGCFNRAALEAVSCECYRL